MSSSASCSVSRWTTGVPAVPRIKERFDHTGDTREAVAYGVGRTASIITGAAAIMVCVFAGMAGGQLVMFQQMGFGLAVAVLIDATVVRTIIVPAAMELLGEWNWYLPRWLEWLPNVERRRPPRRSGAGRRRYVRGPAAPRSARRRAHPARPRDGDDVGPVGPRNFELNPTPRGRGRRRRRVAAPFASLGLAAGAWGGLAATGPERVER